VAILRSGVLVCEFRWCRAQPVAPSHADHACDLGAVERLDKHIVPAEIQDFAPEVLIGMPGCYHEQRRITESVDPAQDIFPTSVGEISFADDYRRRVAIELRYGVAYVSAAADDPAVVVEDVADGGVVFPVGADEQDGNFFKRGYEGVNILRGRQHGFPWPFDQPVDFSWGWSNCFGTVRI
jgi:hypothetical protein